MQLTDNMLAALCQYAITAAEKAGAIIANNSHQTIAVRTKETGESLESQVVTEVDHLAQEVILETLRDSCAEYDLALLTEENPDNGQRLQQEYFWCIDPLDGTLAFIEQRPGYAVSIALVARDGTPVIGVIYDPRQQVLYHAIKGQGAFRNRQPWQTTSVSTAKPLTLIADQSFASHPRLAQTLRELEFIAAKLSYTGMQCVYHGGAAMNACLVLQQAPACYFKFPKIAEGGGCLWDYAASACIFQELSAHVSDYYGRPLTLNRADSVFMNHSGILYSSHAELADLIMRIVKAEM